MNALPIILISIIVLLLGYILYGRWLAKQYGVDPSRPTPAHEFEDNLDYKPAKPIILVGHHFSSIAGVGPITGPIQAAVFGWLPVLLWVLIGGIFFGAVHDFSSLFISVRNKGKSISDIIEKTISAKSKKLFFIVMYVTLILAISAFLSIVAETFEATAGDPNSLSSGRAATISVVMIVAAIALGFVVNRYHPSTLISTILAISLIVCCMFIGYNFPIYLSYNWWLVLMAIYILVASTIPIWILLQPRDFICSFLLYGLLAISITGLVLANPTITLPAFISFESEIGFLFPALFITLACGAISGFHSLVSSGTTSKQIDNEKSMLPIAFGSMLVESLLAVLALISVAILYNNGMPSGTPTEIFATGISGVLNKIGLAQYESYTYSLIILAISAFALTTLDTATRITRMLLQEFLTMGKQEEDLSKTTKILVKPLVASAITVALSVCLALIGYKTVWGAFGTMNQFIAAMAMFTMMLWFKDLNKVYKIFVIPTAFMLVTTLTSMILLIISNAITLTNEFNITSLAILILISILLIIVLIMGKDIIVSLNGRLNLSLTEVL